MRCRQLDIFKTLEVFDKLFENSLKFLGIFFEILLGFFWNFFLEFFWRIVLRNFFGKKYFEGFLWEVFWEDFLGGILWEEFFVYFGIDLFLSRFCLKVRKNFYL